MTNQDYRNASEFFRLYRLGLQDHYVPDSPAVNAIGIPPRRGAHDMYTDLQPARYVRHGHPRFHPLRAAHWNRRWTAETMQWTLDARDQRLSIRTRTQDTARALTFAPAAAAPLPVQGGLRFTRLLGYGGNGLVALFETAARPGPRNPALRRRADSAGPLGFQRFVVKYAPAPEDPALAPPVDLFDDEKVILDRLAGAEHVTQMLPVPGVHPPGHAHAGQPIPTPRELVIMEFCDRGALDDALIKMGQAVALAPGAPAQGHMPQGPAHQNQVVGGHMPPPPPGVSERHTMCHES